MRRFIRQTVRRLADIELVVLVSLSIIIGGTWAFIELAESVADRETQAFDEWVIQSMRRPNPSDPNGPSVPVGPEWLVEIGRDITALGGWAVLVLLTVTVAVFLGISRRRGAMWLLLGASASGVCLVYLLKSLYDRPRPPDVLHLAYVSSASFPSGHSMMSAVIYLTLGTLLSGVLPQPGQKLFVLTVALLMTGLVGVSRVYLGVHYPTDVLAGWAAGLVWATLCWMFLRKLRQFNDGAGDGDGSAA